MYKHKLFSHHPRHLLKSKGSFKIHTKSLRGNKIRGHKIGGSIDDYLLSLINGVKHGMKLSKKHHSSGHSKKKIGRRGGALKFIR
jgi:hypothetical protein